MAAFASMTIADALGTPVNHTFIPARIENGMYVWEDQSAASNPNGVPVGFNTITAMGVMSKDTNAGKGKFALDYRYTQPTLEVVSNSTVTGILPAAIRGYECAVFIKTVFSARSTAQNRADAFKMAVLGYQNSQISDWAKNYQQPT